MTGCFIVFEGIDGAGKTKQVNKLKEKLLKNNYDVVVTKEPTDSGSIGKLIQDILFRYEKVSNEALALLFAADRVDHTKQVINPALSKGTVVISDRYVHSSLAYQGSTIPKLNVEWLRNINKYSIKPDLVIFLDISPETGMERLNKGQKRVVDDNYFESLKKQYRIREIYNYILNLHMTVSNLTDFQNKTKNDRKSRYDISMINGTTILKIDGEKPIDLIHKEISSYVFQFLRRLKIQKLDKPKVMPESLTNYTRKKIPA